MAETLASRRRAAAGMLAALTLAASAADGTEDERTRRLAESLRCVVCQNQTLAESNAELAADLRGRIREQVRQGASDQAIRDYMVRRYGEFVLYSPPLMPATWLLWFGPFAALAAGMLALARLVRRRRVRAGGLDEAGRRRIAALLSDAEASNVEDRH